MLKVFRSEAYWCLQLTLKCIKKKLRCGFPWGSGVKNLPASAGDTGLIPGLGTAHRALSNQARVPKLLSLCSKAWELQLWSPGTSTTEARALEPMLHNKRSHHKEMPMHRN